MSVLRSELFAIFESMSLKCYSRHRRSSRFTKGMGVALDQQILQTPTFVSLTPNVATVQ